MIEIFEVKNKKTLKEFVRFPEVLYKNCPQYVPNLRMDEKAIFTTSPCLDYCKLKMWIVRDGKRVVGRIAAIINPRYNELYNVKRVRFGWIDFEENIEIAKLLLDNAEQWAKEEGMTEIHGPLGYNTWYKQGMLVEGFENVPQVNCIYNYPYYKEFIEKLGFEKECDWVQYKLPPTQGVSDKLRRINDMLLARYPLKVVDLNVIKRQDDLIERFFDHYNETFKRVHNFVPLTKKEIDVLGKQYIKLLRPELNCFVMDDQGRIAAYGICFPSLSEAYQKAKGRLFPFGWWHILRAYTKYSGIDLMMVGADPAWQSKGVSAIFHCHLADNFKDRDLKYSITNPQIEDNSAVKVWDSYQDREDYMRRRCYIKTIK